MAARRDLVEIVGSASITAMEELHDVFFFIKDAERRFVHCNSAFLTLMGYGTLAELLGRRDEDISPEYLVEHYRHHDLDVLTNGTKIVGLIELVHSMDGTYDWFTTTKYPIRLGRRIVGMAGITRSLTKRTVIQDRLAPMAPVIELISREYLRPLRVEDLAATVSMSPSYFARSFKRHFGTSPHQYIRQVRLMAACDLLSTTDLPISAIATRTGYYDQSHLSNDILRERGMTAGTYRRRHRRAPHPVRARPVHPPVHGSTARRRPG